MDSETVIDREVWEFLKEMGITEYMVSQEVLEKELKEIRTTVAEEPSKEAAKETTEKQVKSGGGLKIIGDSPLTMII